MSRLDDELKVAFRREDPSQDFLARVLEQVNRAPAPQPRLWQRFADLFQAQKFRWVALGATAALVVAISAAGYLRIHQTAIEESSNAGAVVATAPGPEAGSGQSNAEIEKAPSVPPVQQPATFVGKRNSARPTRKAVAFRNVARPSPEAEAAKERVLFALQIASNTLNDAQKAIQEDDGPQEKPEPLHNR